MNASTPVDRDVDVAATVATIEPRATVTTKSKLDIFDNDLSPTSRITLIAAINIAIADTTTSNSSSLDAPSHSYTMDAP